MDSYRIAMFLHVVTLIIAASATAVTKLAVDRRIRARSVAEALDWHNVLVSASRAFPICLASFVITGSYMVSHAGNRAWGSGFVVSGLVGVTLLLASGTYLGIKGKSLTQVLEKLAKDGPDRPAPRLVPPALAASLPLVNTGIALGVVFDMVMKPTTVPVALGVLVLGIAVGIGLARRKLASIAQTRTLQQVP